MHMKNLSKYQEMMTTGSLLNYLHHQKYYQIIGRFVGRLKTQTMKLLLMNPCLP